MISSSWLIFALQVINPLIDHPPGTQSVVRKTGAVQMASVSCSSGKSYSVNVKWHEKTGLKISDIREQGRAVKIDNYTSIERYFAATTDLSYARLSCSGDNDAELIINFVKVTEGRAMPVTFSAIIRSRVLMADVAELHPG